VTRASTLMPWSCSVSLYYNYFIHIESFRAIIMIGMTYIIEVLWA